MTLLPERLRAARIERGWTQARLGALACVEHSTQISSYEMGHATPSTEVLVRLSRALGVSTDWLLGADNEPR